MGATSRSGESGENAAPLPVGGDVSHPNRAYKEQWECYGMNPCVYPTLTQR